MMKEFFDNVKYYVQSFINIVTILVKHVIKAIKFLAKHTDKLPLHRFFAWLGANPTAQKIASFLNKYYLPAQAVLSLLVCFILEWLSRHSFISAYYFVTEHTGAYLFNSYVIFVIFSLVMLVRKRTFLRMVLLALLVTFGICNCIILLNRVTPFGFTDISMITDLLTMQNTSYFTATQAAISFAAFVIYTILMVILFIHDKKQEIKLKFVPRLLIVIGLFISVPLSTQLLISTGVLTSYFGNLAQGYLDYGYVYGFGTSMLNRGMNKPGNYNPETVANLIESTDQGASTITSDEGPNVIIMLLESFFDVSECSFISYEEDPIPYFHYLENNYSTGHLEVPVVGAGTCNTEFEVLTGMSCQFFGPGEYPQKTILKKTNVESVASDMGTLGYSSHVIHNNGGNFYSRANAFSMMGFDSFTCKEMLDITEYTPIESWPTDDILIQSTADAMDSTPGHDFVYTITVEGHGDYPSEPIPGDDAVTISCSGKDEATSNKWSYYTNRIHNVDEFLQLYTQMLDERGEDTLLIAFGDHLPTMGLYDHEVSTGDLYLTKYITWNNFDMPKEDADLTSYQLAAEYLSRLGIHDGTVMDYHQTQIEKNVKAGSSEYMEGLGLLQYDLLYGENYAYGGNDLYPASNITMGSLPITIDSVYRIGDKIRIYGDNFSKWSKVCVNGESVTTDYISGQCLEISSDSIKSGDSVVINQTGSSSTAFRSSNEFVYYKAGDLEASGTE